MKGKRPPLRTLKPRLTPMRPKLAPDRAKREQIRLGTRDANVEWRSWYGTARWQRLRLQTLERDLYTCQATGELLSGKHPAPNSPVVDHIDAHRGDPEKFWNPDNLRSVSKAWHDSIKQSMERGGFAATHPDWLKPSIIPLTIVCGPPVSGKTTYVQQHAAPGDLIIDIDTIVAQLSGGPLHGWDRDTWLNPALFRRNDMLGSLSRKGPYPAAWLIVGEPKAEKRDWWQSTMNPIEIVVLETPERECLRRIGSDPDRPYASTAAGIGRWWMDYEPRRGETHIRA